MRFFIHYDGAIGVSLFKGKIVYTYGFPADCLWLHRKPFDQKPYNAVAAGPEIHIPADPGTAFTACFQREGTDQILATLCHPAIIIQKSFTAFCKSGRVTI